MPSVLGNDTQSIASQNIDMCQRAQKTCEKPQHHQALDVVGVDMIDGVRYGVLQLRLQSTVEGLSVAAVTYCVVGLFSYVCKGVQESGLIRIDANLLTFVPVAALAIWLMVRRIRLKHAADDPAE